MEIPVHLRKLPIWILLASLSSLLCPVLSARTIVVPTEIQTLKQAIEEAGPGDTILLEPGVYEENVYVSKPLHVTSRFLMTGLETYVYETIVDGRGKTVFTIEGPLEGAVTLTGLTIRNGDDGIMASAVVNLFHNLVTRCEDGIDYETGGGGILRENVFRENEDDGIDLDGTLHYVVIENNKIFDNEDDGIEIRLHSYQGDSSFCRISGNQIYRNQEDGIQFIDYPDLTPRVYVLERNVIFDNEMAGIGCMDQGDTREDYRGAPIPEPIYLFNNTIAGNEYGITGGANLISVNNLILHSRTTGAYNNSGNSIHSFCLFHGNETDLDNGQADMNSCLFQDPLLTQSYYPLEGSPCIDGGTTLFISGSDTIVLIPETEFTGSNPEIGAIEYTRLSTGNFQENGPEFKVWPNPFTNELCVHTNHSTPDGWLRIYDLHGKIMLSQTGIHTDFKVSLGDLSNGLYVVVYTDHSTTISRKLLKI